MCKLNKKTGNRRVDPCMKKLIRYLQNLRVETLACCCGHGKYPMTIVVKKDNGLYYEVLSDMWIPRQKRFYKKDKQGYYYIPEVMKK